MSVPPPGLNTNCRNNRTVVPLSLVFGHKFYFSISCILVALAILCANSVVIHLLYRKWRLLRKGKRFAFALNLSISDFLIGPVLISVSMVDILRNDSYVLTAILQVLICFNIQLTLTNFSSFLIAQYFAIKHPLYYRTRFTTARVIMLIAISWVFSGFFTCAKYFFMLRPLRYGRNGFLYFPHIDQGVRNCLFILNTFSFVYVFVVALKRKRRHASAYNGRSNQAESTRQNSVEGESFLTTTEGSGGSVIKRKSSSFTSSDIRNYRSIVAAGCRLIVFFCTSIPINAYYCYFLLTHDPEDFVKAYFDVKGTIVSLFILWFLRAVADPLITLASEKSAGASVPSRNSSFNSPKTGFGQQNRY